MELHFDIMRIARMRFAILEKRDWSHLSQVERHEDSRQESEARKERNTKMSIHYLEIVSDDVDNLAALYERMHGLSFGPPDPDLGHARVATRSDGALVGIRKPLAAHEQPIMRTYIAVEDIQQAVQAAEHSGATVAYAPTRQGQRGTFAILIHGGVQHGLWQR